MGPVRAATLPFVPEPVEPEPPFNGHLTLARSKGRRLGVAALGEMAGIPFEAAFAVPSLDLVIYKLGGKDNQYDPALTGLPQPEQSHDRDNWQPLPNTPFFEGNPANSLWRVLELVSLAVKD